jgi:DNA modification methylase
MKVGYQAPDTTIWQGNVLDTPWPIESGSVQTCVTSPPYLGLRDYGCNGQIGLEESVDEFIGKLVAVFREVRRVLRDDGTLWVNLGTSYAGSGKGPSGGSSLTGAAQEERQGFANHRTDLAGFKPKDLILAPFFLAEALRQDGWYLRSTIIWHKRACMPESVTDRPTTAHEYIFLLSKQPDYFYDAEAVREAPTGGTHSRGKRHETPKTTEPGQGIKNNSSWQAATWEPVASRNQRSVWSLSPEPNPEAHFATFPTEIPRRAILAGTSERGCCSICSAPYERVRDGEPVLDMSRPQTRRAVELARERGLTDEHIAAIRAVGMNDAGQAVLVQNGAGKNTEEVKRLAAEAKTALGGYFREFLLGSKSTTGFRPTCSHADAPTRPCLVLDPFMGSGTTALVARQLGRHSVGIELNSDYVAIIERRLGKQTPSLFALTPP